MILNGANAATVERFIALQAEADRLAETWQRVKDYRAFYDGDHPVMLTARQKEYLGPLLTEASSHAVAYNLCRVIVDTLRERLTLQGFAGADAAGQALAAKAWAWYTQARMVDQAQRTYKRALRDAYGYLIVTWNAERNAPEWRSNKAYDGDTGVTFHRDAETLQPIMAVKYWRVADITSKAYGELRRTVYTAGTIMRQKPDAGGPYGWAAIDAGEGKPLEYWTDTLTAGGQPLGLPVIQYANPDGSELANVIGLQLLLDKFVLDLAAAVDATAFQRMAIEYGSDVPRGLPRADEDPDDYDADGSTAGVKVGPGEILEVFGGVLKAIDAGDVSQIITAMDKVTGFIAGSSRTPLYYLQPFGGADVPSGEALKQLESGLISRAEERQTVFGDAWCDAVRVAARLYRAMGNRDVDPDATVTPTWAAAALRNELYDAQVAEAEQRLGVPQEVLWQKRLGYSPDEVAQFKRQKAAEERRRLSTVLGSLNSGAIDETGAPTASNDNGGAAIAGRGGANPAQRGASGR